MGEDDELERGVIFEWMYYVHVACLALAFLLGVVSWVLSEGEGFALDVVFGGLLVVSGICAVAGRKAISLQMLYLDLSRKSFSFQVLYAIVVGLLLVVFGFLTIVKGL